MCVSYHNIFFIPLMNHKYNNVVIIWNNLTMKSLENQHKNGV